MKKLPIVLTFLLSGLLAGAQLTPIHLLCENLPDPIAIDAPLPRFSWQLGSTAKKAERALSQSAYEIRVVPDDAPLDNGATRASSGADLTWSSGRITSDQSVHILYAGQPLQSGRRYRWQVRVWDAKAKPSRWSEPAAFRMALLNTSDWKAQWIEPGYVEDSILRPSPFFRKKFTVAKKLRSAIAYITAHGLYDASLNGKRIGDALLTPGWTSYNKRLQYQAYDVTNLLQNGDNAVGVMLGSGWYRGNLAWAGNHNLYGKTLGLLFQLALTYTDGTTETVVSDNSWKSSTGEIVYSEIYNGEIIDARKQKPGWTTAPYDDATWSGVQTPGTKPDNLVSTWNEAVKKHEVLHPVRIFRTPAGELVADFGQNMVGWVHIKVKGAAGDSVKIFHAEVLDKHGDFYTTNLRAAKEENIYILRGGGAEESFEPHFTWQGFRYIRLEGYPGELKPEDLYATVLYSDMPQTGTFSCSDPLLNQLQHNIEWGLRGNFLDVPTDCPQRDERLGWTGDAQVFSRTASFLRNVDNFFAKWLRDVSADQFSSGAVPHVIPNVLGNGGGSTGWSDVSTIVPWNMYLAYGDKKILETQYPGMKAWVGYMIDQSKSHDYLWNTGGHFGDWLSYWPEGHAENAANTDSYLIAQTFFAHSTQLVIDAARVLGHQDDVEKYTGVLQKVKAAFQREYATPDGRLVSNTQTAYTLALQFDMLPEAVRHTAAERLVRNIRDYNNHLTTGFLGTPYLCHVLSRFGYTDVAYTLLFQQTYPSWLYPVKMGATTIWERWDGQKTDSSFEDAGMNSFNHYAYGAIGDWLYRVAAGIDTYDSAPGYKKIRIMPHPTDSLTYMNADLDTYYGRISSHWKHEGGHLTLDVTIPINTTATIYIPDLASGKAATTATTAITPTTAITEAGQPLSAHPEIKLLGQDNGYVIVETGSGTYHFQTN
jgi:alpha-L-rhamnosidase